MPVERAQSITAAKAARPCPWLRASGMVLTLLMLPDLLSRSQMAARSSREHFATAVDDQGPLRVAQLHEHALAAAASPCLPTPGIRSGPCAGERSLTGRHRFRALPKSSATSSRSASSWEIGLSVGFCYIVDGSEVRCPRNSRRIRLN